MSASHRQVEGFSPSVDRKIKSAKRGFIINDDDESLMFSLHSSTIDDDDFLNQQKQQLASTTSSSNAATIRAAASSFVRSVRQRIYKLVVLWFVIYPLYFMRKLSEKYTKRKSDERQKQRCNAIMQSTEEYSTWKSVAVILDKFAGYEKWRKKRDDDGDDDGDDKQDEELMMTKNNSNKFYYDEERIREAADFVDCVSNTNNEVAMGTYIRSSLVRELFGIGGAELHKYYVGSKDSVEHYLEAVEKMIRKFASPKDKRRVNINDDNNKWVREEDTDDEKASSNNNNNNHSDAADDDSEDPPETVVSSTTCKSNNNDNSSNINNKKSLQKQQQQVAIVTRNQVQLKQDDDDQEDDFGSHLNTSTITHQQQNLRHIGPHHLDLLQWAQKDDVAAETEADRKQLTINNKNNKNNLVVANDQYQKRDNINEMIITSDDRSNPNTLLFPCSNDNNNNNNNTSQSQQQQQQKHYLSAKEKFHLLKDAAQAFGRTALMLSGGASLGMYHAGVVRALWSAKLLPKIISGSSAGAIIASIFCTRTDEECDDLLADSDAGGLEEKVSLNAFDSYDDPLTSISTRVWRLIKTGAFMDVQILMDCMRANCGDSTFAEAYKRTGRILNIAVASVSREGGKNAKSLVLNYVTAPNVLIWTAVAASCAYPRLFTAVQLLQKHPITSAIHPYLPGQRWNDGSITADLPAERLAELFNANFFIVSQVNPHVAPFIRPSLGHLMHKEQKRASTLFGGVSKLVQELWYTACEELRHWILKCFRFGIISLEGENEVVFLQLSQKYSGSVTIRPIRSFLSALPDYVNLTSNPTKELLQFVTGTAQRRTWPHISRLEANMRIELALQKAMTDLLSMSKNNIL